MIVVTITPLQFSQLYCPNSKLGSFLQGVGVNAIENEDREDRSAATIVSTTKGEEVLVLE
jgi:hypothetical protein